MWGTT
jgi:hypothetical protein